MRPTLLAQTLQVPAARWVPVINTFLSQLGPPTLVLPAGRLPVDAEQVAWGTGDDELRCIKEYSASFVPGGKEYFAGCPSAKATTLAFDILHKSGLMVKDELRIIQEFALVGCKIKKRDILLGSFYLPQSTKALKDSDVLGVIHNPNYPDALYPWPKRGACNPGQLLSYGLAGVVGAALATWLGRRGRR